MSHSRDRLLEEQNAAYLESVRADEEKVRSNLGNKKHASLSFPFKAAQRAREDDERRQLDEEQQKKSKVGRSAARESSDSDMDILSRSSPTFVKASNGTSRLNPPRRILTPSRSPYACRRTSRCVDAFHVTSQRSASSNSPGRIPMCPISSNCSGVILVGATSTSKSIIKPSVS